MGRKKYQKLLYLFMVFVCIGSIAAADDKHGILPIKSVPDVVVNNNNTDKDNPAFSGQGMIQRIGKDETGGKVVIIDDRLMYVTSGIRYYNAKAQPVSAALFHKGKQVGYVFNEKRHITQLYLISH